MCSSHKVNRLRDLSIELREEAVLATDIEFATDIE